MARGLTKKQRGFVKDYVKTGNGRLAAENNYDVKNELTARVISSENLTKPSVVKEVEKLQKTMAERLPNELLERVHLEGLAATQVRFTPEGEQIKVEDYRTRALYLDMANKIKDNYAAEKHVNVNIEVKPTSKVKELAEKLNANRRS